MRGSASASDAGHTVALEFARGGATVWSQLGSTTVGGAGAFRLAARLEHSGLVRVLDTSSGSLTPFVACPRRRRRSRDEQARARRRRGRRSRSDPPINILAGQAVLVRGRLFPPREAAR